MNGSGSWDNGATPGSRRVIIVYVNPVVASASPYPVDTDWRVDERVNENLRICLQCEERLRFAEIPPWIHWVWAYCDHCDVHFYLQDEGG